MAKKPKVAVIGAGSAGTLAAYEIYKKYGTAVDITVYERSEHAGGRAHDIEFAGTVVEVGGSILHSSGKYTNELMEFTGAKEGIPGVSLDGDSETYAFWTEKGFPVFTKTTLVSMALNILKYVGIPSALKVVNTAIDMSKKWESVYQQQENGRVFKTTEELLLALDLFEETRTPLGSFLEKKKVNKRMAEDIVEAIVHNMYNQGLELNAFAGLVGLAGAGLAGGYLFAVDGGNWSLFEKTIQKMNVAYHSNTAVVSVDIEETAEQVTEGGEQEASQGETAGKKQRYTFEVSLASGTSETFDLVVIAAPFALSGISVSKNGSPLEIPVNAYQQVNTTLVAGELNPEYFGVKTQADLPSTVFTASSAQAPFQSVGVTGFSPKHNRRIYKIFSAEREITRAELSEIFNEVAEVTTFVWDGAYPVLLPNVEHVPFEIQPGLYYACALETAAGSIEVEAVGGVNTAALANEYLDALLEA